MNQDQNGRIIAAVDMDYFYAQCEELRHTEYSDKPIIVGMFSGRTEISGAVATANYAARKYGIKSGMPLARAKRLVKDIDHLMVKADFPYYESVSGRIMEILKEYSSIFVQESIDEAFIDITERVKGSFDAASLLGKEIKERILKETGIKCTVGIGPNRLIAKMACDSAKPDGLKVVRPDEVESFLKGKPVDSLYGIGSKTSEKMKSMGINTVDQLAAASLERLQKEFGPKLGLYFYLAARGIDQEPLVARERDQIGRMMTLKSDTRDVNDVINSLATLIPEIDKELKGNSLSYRTVSVVVVDTDLKYHTRSRTLKTKELEGSVALEVARQLLSDLLQSDPEIVVRRAGISVSTLSKEEGQKQLTAFFSQEGGSAQ